jgi:phage tail sheath protein FI
MPTYATPGVYFERVDLASQGVAAIRTDIAGFVGIAEKGPVHEATAVNSWQQFLSTFGTFIPNGYLAYSAKAFFENGGDKMYVVRVVAPEAVTVTNTLVAQPPDGSASIVLSVEGFTAGALATVQQIATTNAVGAQPADRLSSLVSSVAGFPAGSLVQVSQPLPSVQAWHKVQAVDSVAKRLYWETPFEPDFLLAPPITFTTFHQEDRLLQKVDPASETLTWTENLGPAFDVTQQIQIATGASRSAGVFSDADSVPTLEVKASSPGTWGDSLAVSVSRSSHAATAASAVTQPPGGQYSYVQSVVGFPRWSLVKVYQSHLPAPTIGYRTVTFVDPATNILRWDSPLVAPFDVTKPISFETVEFSLTVYLSGSAKEIFTGLSLHPKHSRYAPGVVNPQTVTPAQQKQIGMPSQYIRVKDLNSPSAPPDNLPDPGALQLSEGVLYLWGGRDGIAALKTADFTGNPASAKKWGIRALEDVDEISVVAVPDILIEPVPPITRAPIAQKQPDPCLPGAAPIPFAPPPAPPPSEASPSFSLDQVFQVQQALIQHCRDMQFRFAILDPPDFGYPKLHVDLGEVQSWRQRFDTKFAALYYPWVFVRDPLQMGNSVVRRIPPSGHVAGVYANTDLTVGVYKAPANTVVRWAQDLTTEVTPEMQGFLNPIAVDCIRTFPGRGMRVYGARTLSSEPSWRFVNVRRLLFMIEHALLISMQWVVFEPNNVHLWHLVRVSISNFLEGLWRKGALEGNTAEESFYVKCDETNNPPATTSLGELIVEIGVAPSAPAEFVVFRIGRAGDTLEVSE